MNDVYLSIILKLLNQRFESKNFNNSLKRVSKVFK